MKSFSLASLEQDVEHLLRSLFSKSLEKGNASLSIEEFKSGEIADQYDAANRLVKIKADDNVTVLASYTYGDTNERLMVDEGGLRTYYACDGKVEYTESGSSTTPAWSKSYVYSTLEPGCFRH